MGEERVLAAQGLVRTLTRVALLILGALRCGLKSIWKAFRVAGLFGGVLFGRTKCALIRSQPSARRCLVSY